MFGIVIVYVKIFFDIVSFKRILLIMVILKFKIRELGNFFIVLILFYIFK